MICTIKEVFEDKNEKIIVDIRAKEMFDLDSIPDAISLKELEVFSLPKDKPIYLLGYTGYRSDALAKELCQQGYNAKSIEGGYYSFVEYRMEQENDGKPVDRCRAIERSIIKKYRKEIWSKFMKAVTEYQLIEPGDKIAVCISGGKDSVLMAKCFEELKRHGKIDFELVFLVMNPGYNELNYSIIQKNAEVLHLPIHVFESSIFEYVSTQEGAPCYLCARMRRGHLNNAAKELGCNKIALGHHYDDVIETILMGMLYGAQVQSMMPKLHSTNFEGMELIRPLYLVREKDIMAWRDYNGLEFLQCACKFTEMAAECDSKENISKRKEIKELIREMKKTNPLVENRIFRSVENVNVDTVIAYKKGGEKHNFLDEY